MKNILSIQSHVVFGHAGNSAAVFSMRRMGVNVWPLNTVQFSNHTQYGQWTGCVMPATHLTDIVNGIVAINSLKHCDAVLSGYIGASDQGEHISIIVQQVKKANPAALYLLDPVMGGNINKGCIVTSGVAEYYSNTGLSIADIIAPNLYEMEYLSGHRISSIKEAIFTARELMRRGPRMVLVKHLNHAGYNSLCFEMLLVTIDQAWHIQRPLIDFGTYQPVGVGDLTSGLFLVNFLKGLSLKKSLEHVTAAVYSVLKYTKECGEYELQIVGAQDQITLPKYYFPASLIT